MKIFSKVTWRCMVFAVGMMAATGVQAAKEPVKDVPAGGVSGLPVPLSLIHI